MKVKAITMAREKAREEWKTYFAMLKKRKDRYLKEFKDAYWQLAKGRKILDIYGVFKAVGTDEKGRPRFAIAPTFAEKIRFSYWPDHARFYGHGGGKKYDVVIPKGILPKLPKSRKEWWDANAVETIVPMIPAQFLPLGKYGYYVLWAVKEWGEVPKDPILLKRVSRNLFAVLATWKMTNLEQAIVWGRV